MSRRGLDVLAAVPLFAGLPKRSLRKILDVAEEARFMEGARIVKQGERGDSFFVILAGEAKVENAKGRTIGHLFPGDFFGEISLLDGGPRSATVVAVTPLATIILERGPFNRMLEQDAGIGATMLKELAIRLRRAERPIGG